MSRKKSIQRALRMCTPDEEAFTALLSVFEAMLQFGFPESSLSVGFFPKKDAKGGCTPSLIVRQADRAFTYRLDEHRMLGMQEKCEERWRAWIGELVGNRPEDTRLVLRRFYDKSEFNKPHWQKSVLTALRAAGIRSPLETDEESERHSK